MAYSWIGAEENKLVHAFDVEDVMNKLMINKGDEVVGKGEKPEQSECRFYDSSDENENEEEMCASNCETKNYENINEESENTEVFRKIKLYEHLGIISMYLDVNDIDSDLVTLFERFERTLCRKLLEKNKKTHISTHSIKHYFK